MFRRYGYPDLANCGDQEIYALMELAVLFPDVDDHEEMVNKWNLNLLQMLVDLTSRAHFDGEPNPPLSQQAKPNYAIEPEPSALLEQGLQAMRERRRKIT